MQNLRIPRLKNRIGCQVILDRINNTQSTSEKTLLLWDFLTKFIESDLDQIDPVTFDAFYSFLPVEYRESFRLLRRSGGELHKAGKILATKNIDVIILTIILQELTAAKIALNIDLDQEPDEQIEGLRCWETEIPRHNEDQPLKVVLSMVGVPRTTPCALACETLIRKYEIREAAILVGIAAGVEEKVKLGDTVSASNVFDYEGARVEENGTKRRPLPSSLNYNIKMDLANYDPERLRWHEQFRNSFDKLSRIEEVPELEEDWKPSYHHGVILSGEKLIADGSMQAKREDYTDEMRALDMESSGFSQTWHKHDIPWIIFRGISDYGDQRKKGSKVWQTTAALVAATAAVNFLSKTYTRRTIPKF